MNNVKIIRLQSGEDIIATYTDSNDNDGTVLLNNPMSLMFKRLPTGKAVMLMSPWLPLELIEGSSAWLYTDDILSIMQPRASVIDYYNKMVEEITLEMFEKNSELDAALSEMDYSEPDETFSLDDLLGREEDESIDEEELRNEMEQLRNDIKRKLLH